MAQTKSSSGMRIADFWLLGGASIAAWMVFAIAQLLRSENPLVEHRLQQVGPTFALLSLLFNHPHFMASYRMAYGRSLPFYRRNWVAMLAVPVLLVLLFGVAYANLQTSAFNLGW